MKKYLFSLAALTFLSAPTFALDGCAQPKTAYDATYCTAKLFIESDKELNETYSELSHLVTPEVKKELVRTQREWIKYRNNHCSNNGTINVDCNLEVNKARQAYLSDRLRECKIGHCQKDLITRQDFSVA